MIHDHHAGTVKLQAGFEILGKILVRHAGGNKQQCLIGHSALYRYGDHRLRRGEFPEALLIELIIFLAGDLALLALPQGHHGVQRFPFGYVLILRLVIGTALFSPGMGGQHPNGEADIVAVFLHQTAQRIFIQILAVFVLLFRTVGLQMHDDVSAHGILVAGFHGVAVHAGGLPAIGLIAAVFLCHHGDLIGHHECGVETHAELADDIGIRCLLSLQLALKLKAAAVGDHTQMVFQLTLVHADAVIADGQRAIFLIRRQDDAEIIPVQAHLIICQSQIAQLVDGVGGVGNDLPQEDLLVGIDGVDHQIQQPLGLRLELFLSHDMTPFIGRGRRTAPPLSHCL